MAARCFVNGQVCDAVDCRDRGLAYGDGVFTSMAVRDGQPCLWDMHAQRLRRDCRGLGIGFAAWEELRREVFVLAAGQAAASIKAMITRGRGRRGYRPPQDEEAGPTRVVILYRQSPPLFAAGRQAAHLTVCRHRLPHNPALAGLKHLNRLDQVLARSEWRDEYQEGLMLDQHGAVVEGTMSNVFICSDDALLTPPLDGCGVQGVMRRHVISQAEAQGVPWAEKTLTMDDFYHADGAFLCNSLIGLWPIGKIAERPLPMNGGLASFIKRTAESLRTGDPCSL